MGISSEVGGILLFKVVPKDLISAPKNHALKKKRVGTFGVDIGEWILGYALASQ